MPREVSVASSSGSTRGSTASYYCFTIANPVGNDDPRVFEAVAKYCVWQREECPTTHTPHLQCYMALKKPQRIVALKKIHATAHFEVRRGTHIQAKEYCQKDESKLEGPWEFGTEDGIPAGRGARKDLDQVKELLDQNVPEAQIQDDHWGSWVRYHKSFELYRCMRAPPRSELPEIRIYWGLSGTGKTHRAREWLPNAFYLSKPKADKNLWWDGYQTGQDLVIDEFYGWIDYDTILRIMDKYPLQVQVKGGSVQFNSPRICFTSNQSPEKWYGPRKNRVTGDIESFDISALQRRLTQYCTIEHLEELYTPLAGAAPIEPEFDFSIAGFLPDQ